MPSGVVVTPGDSALTVRWDAVSDEVGKPPVSGYEVALPGQEGRPGDSGEWGSGRSGKWQDGLIVDSRTDTSVTLTGLTNDQAYQVRVRTLTHPGEGTLTYGGHRPMSCAVMVSPVAVSGTPGEVPTDLGICGRTPQVRDALLSLIPEVTDCALVTEAHLSTITDTLYLRRQEITALKAGDFAGLSRLSVLRLGSNSLTALPERYFLRSGQLARPPAWRQCPEQPARTACSPNCPTCNGWTWGAML